MVARPGSFGARPCRAIRARLFEFGVAALPKGWQRSWIIARIRNTPPWADFAAIKRVYEEARARSTATGQRHVVDHIIPLQSPHVSGLHVAANLQVKHWLANQHKSNKFADPNQLELDFEIWVGCTADADWLEQQRWL